MILVYENRKSYPMVWDISSSELTPKAFLELFKYLKDEWQVYESDYWGDDGSPDGKAVAKKQKQLYKKACQGDAEAAQELLTMRRSYEYEEWRISDQ